MSLFENMQVWEFLVGQAVIVGGALISLTKMYGRVAQLEKDKDEIIAELRGVREREEPIKNDIVAIRVSLARIETTLEELKRK